MVASAKWLARAFEWVLREEAEDLKAELSRIQDPARRARAFTLLSDLCRAAGLEE